MSRWAPTATSTCSSTCKDASRSPGSSRSARTCSSRPSQETVDAFAYPHGYHRAVTRRLVRGAGFTSACAVRNEISHVDDDPFALARIMLTSDQSVPFLRQALAPEGVRVSRGRSRLRSHAWRWVRRVRTRGRPLVEVSLV